MLLEGHCLISPTPVVCSPPLCVSAMAVFPFSLTPLSPQSVNVKSEVHEQLQYSILVPLERPGLIYFNKPPII